MCSNSTHPEHKVGFASGQFTKHQVSCKTLKTNFSMLSCDCLNSGTVHCSPWQTPPITKNMQTISQILAEQKSCGKIVFNKRKLAFQQCVTHLHDSKVAGQRTTHKIHVIKTFNETYQPLQSFQQSKVQSRTKTTTSRCKNLAPDHISSVLINKSNGESRTSEKLKPTG